MDNNDYQNTNNEYSKEYSESSFWEKVKKFAANAGIKVIFNALILYYTLQSTETPAWAKTAIIAALGYFIAPLDIIPDAIPAVGFADDLGALATAYTTVSTYITSDIKQQAKEKMKDWFGGSELNDLN